MNELDLEYVGICSNTWIIPVFSSFADKTFDEVFNDVGKPATSANECLH